MNNTYPSQRQSLAGLDDFVAAGMNGFTTLNELAGSERALQNQLEHAKRTVGQIGGSGEILASYSYD